MTPPLPAAFTADEHEPDPPPLALYATIRRALAIVGAVVIVAAVAGLAGYAAGRGKSRGELTAATARVDSLERARAAVDTVTVHDSIVAAVSAADYKRLRDSLLLALAQPGLTQIDVRNLAARQVPAVVAAADAALNACFAVLHDCQQQRALADSLVRVLRDMPVIGAAPLIEVGLAPGYDPARKGAALRLDGRLRVSDRWSVIGDWQVTQGAGPVSFAGARVALWRWP